MEQGGGEEEGLTLGKARISNPIFYKCSLLGCPVV